MPTFSDARSMVVLVHIDPNCVCSIRAIRQELMKRYIPFWGTYRYANRAPITKVNSRLSTYLLLRRLLSESEPIEIEKKRYGKSQRVYKSKHLTEYLGTEVVYSKALHKDISGEWTSCCSCLW